MIRAVVFDLDGLMFDTEALFFRVSCEALAARGRPFTHETMQSLIGRRAPEARPIWESLAGDHEPVDVLLADVRERFFAEVDTAVHPTPGLFVLLDHLKRRGLPLAVATSSRRDYVNRLLIRHGIADRFAFVLTSEDVTCGKPDPQIYRLAAMRFGVAPESMLVLEDSVAGLSAAKGAGAIAVGVPHEHSPAHVLGHADLLVTRLDSRELLSLIESSTGEINQDER